MEPRLYIAQKITPLVNRYVVYKADASGGKAKTLAFVEQKRFSFKEKVIFYADERKQEVLFGFRAEKVLDVHGKFLVEDKDGKLIGAFAKDFKSSLLFSTWNILNQKSQPAITITESNKILALLRRFVGFVPIIGDLFEVVLLLFKYHFAILDAESKRQIGFYRKTTLLRDEYLLSADTAAYDSVDWRVWASAAVALDALQSR